MSILQGYDVQIRHIPGKVNPADALTRQIQADDAEYAGRVRQEDQDWMTNVRVPSEATDSEIQQRLNQLYSKKDKQDNKKVAMQYVLPEHTKQQCTVLAISSSAVSIDVQMRTTNDDRAAK